MVLEALEGAAQQAQDTWLDNWGNWASIVAAVIALTLFLGIVALWIWRKLRWRRPLDVSYFVPKATYARTSFAGAPENPEFPKRLTVGVGEYCLILRVHAKRANVIVQGIQIEFQGGPETARPRNLGLTAARLVRQFRNDLGEEVYEDWDGHVRAVREASRFPKHFTGDKDHWLPGHVIQTTGPWKGTAQAIIHWRSNTGPESSSVRESLPFEVSTAPAADEIPFLRRRIDALTEIASELERADELLAQNIASRILLVYQLPMEAWRKHRAAFEDGSAFSDLGHLVREAYEAMARHNASIASAAGGGPTPTTEAQTDTQVAQFEAAQTAIRAAASAVRERAA
jgi:hypothetical protein